MAAPRSRTDPHERAATEPVLPNLVIAGFPKCGTSSVFEWLCLHPDVCGSSVKETNFLFDEPKPDSVAFHTHGLDAYGRFFQPRGAERVIVEATPNYTTQDTPIEVLAGLPTAPRILVLVREPAARVLSQYRFLQQNLGRLAEDVSFRDWLRTDKGQRNVDISRYHRHLVRWAARFDDDRLRVLVFEELVRDPAAVMGGICDWLGIDGALYGEVELAAHNRTQAVRHPGLAALAHRLRAHVPAGAVNRLLPLWQRLVAHPVSPPRESDLETRRELRAEFDADNRALARDFGLDLAAWTAGD